MRLIFLFLATIVAFGATFLTGPPALAAPAHLAVTMDNFAFSPAALSIHTGDTVTWTNRDVAPHDVTVTSGPVAVHSPTMTTGQSWSFTFTTAGTYSYICSVHPDMHASLVVAAAPVAAAPSTSAPSPSREAGQSVPSVAAAVRSKAAGAARSAPAATKTHRTAAPSPSSSPVAAAAASSPTSTTHELKPLLLVAGLVAAVATFCLLLLASRPDEDPAG